MRDGYDFIEEIRFMMFHQKLDTIYLPPDSGLELINQ